LTFSRRYPIEGIAGTFDLETHHWPFNDLVELRGMLFQIIKGEYISEAPSFLYCRTIEMIAICTARPRKDPDHVGGPA